MSSHPPCCASSSCCISPQLTKCSRNLSSCEWRLVTLPTPLQVSARYLILGWAWNYHQEEKNIYTIHASLSFPVMTTFIQSQLFSSYNSAHICWVTSTWQIDRKEMSICVTRVSELLYSGMKLTMSLLFVYLIDTLLPFTVTSVRAGQCLCISLLHFLSLNDI